MLVQTGTMSQFVTNPNFAEISLTPYSESQTQSNNGPTQINKSTFGNEANPYRHFSPPLPQNSPTFFLQIFTNLKNVKIREFQRILKPTIYEFIMELSGRRQRDLIVMCYCSIDETTTFHSSYKRSSNFMSTCTFTIYDDQLARHSVTVQFTATRGLVHRLTLTNCQTMVRASTALLTVLSIAYLSLYHNISGLSVDGVLNWITC